MIESPLLEPDDPGKSVARSEHRAALLWKSAQVLLTATDANEMLRTLFHEIREDLDVDTYFNVPGRGRISRGCGSHPVRAYRRRRSPRIQRLDFGEAICGRVAAERAPIAAADIQHSSDPQVQTREEVRNSRLRMQPVAVRRALAGEPCRSRLVLVTPSTMTSWKSCARFLTMWRLPTID